LPPFGSATSGSRPPRCRCNGECSRAAAGMAMTAPASANRSHPLSTTCVIGSAASSTRSNAFGSSPAMRPCCYTRRRGLIRSGRKRTGSSSSKAIGRNGLDLVLPWGNSAERERAKRIVARRPAVYVGERQPLDAVARQLASAAFVVGVDTGLLHIAAALGVPLVAILVHARSRLTVPVSSGHTAVLGAPGSLPTVVDVTRAVERIANW
jgi:Glycosyltransferase family 9 (heptosyltransferase)